MEKLPFEILEKIIAHIPSQRDIANCSRVCKGWRSSLCFPPVYATIELTSTRQVEKFLHFAKTKTIHKTPIGHFVYCLKLYTSDISKSMLARIPYTLPNIQHVIDLTEDRKHHERLQQKLNIAKLTHFYYWNAPFGPKLLHQINVDKVVCLQFYVYEIYIYLTNRHPPYKYFGLRQDKSITRSIIRDDQDTEDFGFTVDADGLFHHYSKVMELPYLPHLTTLSLTFIELEQWETVRYDIDERTLESIYITCPLLESLDLREFDMNISNTFEKRFLSSPSYAIQPMTSLKTFIMKGKFYDARCCYYISKKYPQLEEFNLSLDWPDRQDHMFLQRHQDGLYEPFYLSIHNMMTSFKHLKRLEFNIPLEHGRFNYSYFTPSLPTLLNNKYWAHPTIISWLLSSSVNFASTLTHLDFPLHMLMFKARKINRIRKHHFYSESNNSSNNNNSNNNNNNNNNSDGIDDSLKDPSLLYVDLNHHLNSLTSLSLIIEFDIKKVVDFLLQNGKKTVGSLTLTELKMDYRPNVVDIYLDGLDNNESITINDDFYIYEWLAMFPKLKVFNFKSGVLIKDGIRPRDRINNGPNSGVQQQNSSPIAQSYPLEELIIRGGSLYFKNGFTSFCQKCPHLKRIDFRNIYYALPNWKEQDVLQVTHIHQKDEKSKLYKDMVLDLSHLRLDYVSLYRVRYMPWFTIEYTKQPIISTLVLEETAYNKIAMIYSDRHRAPSHFSSEFPMEVESFPAFFEICSPNRSQFFAEMQPFNQFSLRIICKSLETLVFRV
ncbi:unnamed protein product [Cunninghamella echinulata]